MGSTESKMLEPVPVQPEPAIKKTHVSNLIDPRSPSTAIDRTPIQVNEPGTKSAVCPFVDPRSPTVGINRTPVREIMRAKVGSFARRLGMLFLNESEGKFTPQKCISDNVEEEQISKDEELASTEPLLTPRLSQTYGSLAEHANLLAAPVLAPYQSKGDSSPFVVLEEPQVEVEIETEADISLEEAQEARESPLHKRLSMSLITCHEGATSSQIFAEVHHDGMSPMVPNVSVEPIRNGVDHSYALPLITVAPETDEGTSPNNEQLRDSAAETPPAQPEEEHKPSSSEEPQEPVEGNSLPPAPISVAHSHPEQPQLSSGIHCPVFDPKSPSQVVFKPQWLGKGFGAPGLRIRGVQGQSGKRGSSPLAVRVAFKNASNENKGQSGKLKQKGTEGRSPLQILNETNSPRDQRSQMKAVSTPDRQRPGQMDRRVLAVTLDKENR